MQDVGQRCQLPYPWMGRGSPNDMNISWPRYEYLNILWLQIQKHNILIFVVEALA